ncbi:MAG: hypothetical protein R3C03_16480 [Pirellulaceae bacterium]
MKSRHSATGMYLKRFAEGWPDRERRKPTRSRIEITGCTGRNLQSVDLRVPLGVFCQVMGVSGSGKTSLVRDTLYAALAKIHKKDCETSLPFKNLVGVDRVDDVILIDDSGLTRSSRSNPATFIKVFDLIRKLFAETEDAKKKNFTAKHFSFNVAGGRCDKCSGEGFLDVDMHFLSDMRIVCDECQGKRFRKDVLDVNYRGTNISEVLSLTIQQAFPFFRGQRKLQYGLKPLLDAGLGYLRLGQPLSQLSAGEERRLKLAQHLGQSAQKKTLFVVLKPTAGLHYSEIPKLVDCFDALLGVGHSLLVVDNHPALCQYADWGIELGPMAGASGGRIVLEGTPDEMFHNGNTIFSLSLKDWFQNDD